MNATTLWAQQGVIAPHWQLGDLGTLAAERAWLIGWDAAPDEEGVPAAVGHVIAHALAATVRVSFLRSGPRLATTTGWVADSNGDFSRATRSTGVVGAALDRIRGRREPRTLVCTTRADAMAVMFDDPACPWWLQSQVLLLSALDAPPPDVTPEQAADLLDDGWAAAAAALRDRGVLAVGRPAVDGDALGLLALDATTAQRVVAAFAAHARSAGLGWSGGAGITRSRS